MRARDRIIALGLGAAVLVGLLCQAVPAQGPGPDSSSRPRRQHQAPADPDDSGLPTDSGQHRPQVADVIILGSKVISPDQLMAQLKTKPGVEYNQATVQDDLRTLTRIRKFKDVRPSIRQEADGRIIVVFTIFDYPSKVEEVIYQGNKHLSKDELEKLTGIRKDASLNPGANQEGCKKIVRKLNEDGRPFASCDLLSGDKPGDTKVIFNITEGPKLHLRAVYFNGNKWASSGRLMAQLQTKPLLNGVLAIKYNVEAIKADIEKLVEYYKTFGFLSARITYGMEMTEDGRDVIITYYIDEGMRYTYAHPPIIAGNRFVPNEQLLQLCSAKPGEHYSEPVVRGDVNKLGDYIGYTGRTAIVHEDLKYYPDTPGAVDVIYNVEEKPIARVGQIWIVGNTPHQAERHPPSAAALPRPVAHLSGPARRRAQLAAHQHL